MATIAELTLEGLEIKNDILRAEQEQKLREIFSADILGIYGLIGVRSFSDIVAETKLITSTIDLRSLRGLDYLVRLKEISVTYLDGSGQEVDMTGLVDLETAIFHTNKLTNIGSVSNLINLRYLHLANNNLSSIGKIDSLINMTKLYIYGNSLSSVGRLINLTSLVDFFAYNNSFTGFGRLHNLTVLERFRVQNNNLNVAVIDLILEDLAMANTGLALVDVNLSGNASATGGLTNPYYLTLLSQGVIVTIDS